MMSERFDHELVFHCPDVDENARCSLRFMRTLRIPDDGQCYPLPPGLGRFQLSPVVDESARSVPEAWRRRGGVMMPMYQAEAMWISFETVLHPEHALEWPFAIQVATGRINAVSGKPWQPGQPLVHRPQDYVVIPGQPWLDGFCVQKGRIRQFVAMTLGEGHTAEEQLTGVAEHGGLQITAIPMKREPYLALVREAAERRAREREIWGSAGGGPVECMSMGMGMAPGGLMIQDIYQSEHDPEVWDQAQAVHACVHVLNSEQWRVASTDNSGIFGVTTEAWRARSAKAASASATKSRSPLVATITGSSTTMGGCTASSQAATAAIISASKSMPILTASTRTSALMVSNCWVRNSVGGR